MTQTVGGIGIAPAPAGPKTSSIKAGVFYRNGGFTRVDSDAALAELHATMKNAFSCDDAERRKLPKALLSHVRAFDRSIDPACHGSFYRQNSSL